MLLGPGKDGYDLKYDDAAKEIVDQLLAQWPQARHWWSGVEDLLRTSGHIIGQSIHFRGRAHRLISFSSIENLHPAIDLIYIIVADELTVDFVEMNIRDEA
jgi:hypothetical protein